ncbi:MAG: alpha/beta fold hydrolase [Bacteroidota bacterium]
MPLVNSNYNPPFWQKSGHLSTIYAGLLRKVPEVIQERERITLKDGDFLDLDWTYSTPSSKTLVIVLHGLEGSAQRHYMLGSAKVFTSEGWDTCAVNFRGCSGSPNRTFRSYHSGATEDLVEILEHVVSRDRYDTIFIKGFSLGGNLTLKYVGEGNSIPKQVKGAVAVSVPCDLTDSCRMLMSSKNVLYAKRFKKHLLAKLHQKQEMFPELVAKEDIANVITLKDFDDFYTSKAHDFKDANDYYQKCSAKQFLPQIQIPSLLINAQNDSFLGVDCFPFTEAENSTSFFLETPKYGGHVGFWGPNNLTYTERRALEFFKELQS